MERVTVDRPLASIVAAVIGAALVGAALLSPVGVNVAQAQTEPLTAANGVVLPSPYYDPAAARIEDIAESTVAAATATVTDPPAAESTATDAPEAVAETSDVMADAPDAVNDAPEAVNSAPIVLGGADVAVSSVGGSYEVDRPNKRSDRKK